MILDETRERFIKAMVKEVDPARIAEIHFFAPIRQGGVESGVAVIAARHPEDAPQSAASEGPLDAEEESPQSAAAEEPPDVEEESPQSAAAEGALDAAEESPQSAAAEGPLDAEEESPHRAAAEGPLDAKEESPYSDDIESSASAHSDPSEAPPPQDDSNDASIAASDANADVIDPSDSGADDDAPASTPIERHVIYTARYRLTLKGPDRGKWETNVTAEADAPIITVDAVVRGVQRRAGDVDEPTRMTGEEIRSALPAAV